MRHREQQRVGVDDDRDVAGHLLEAVLEPQPQFLHAVEGALGVGRVAAVVARGEAERVGLDPRHLAAVEVQIYVLSRSRAEHATLLASSICLDVRP